MAAMPIYAHSALFEAHSALFEYNTPVIAASLLGQHTYIEALL